MVGNVLATAWRLRPRCSGAARRRRSVAPRRLTSLRPPKRNRSIKHTIRTTAASPGRYSVDHNGSTIVTDSVSPIRCGKSAHRRWRGAVRYPPRALRRGDDRRHGAASAGRQAPASAESAVGPDERRRPHQPIIPNSARHFPSRTTAPKGQKGLKHNAELSNAPADRRRKSNLRANGRNTPRPPETCSTFLTSTRASSRKWLECIALSGPTTARPVPASKGLHLL